MNKTDELASTHLGKKSQGSENYNPSLLVAIPRCENRKQYNINDNNLPFDGFDVWHAYEFSALTQNGVPVTRLLKLKYDCKSKFLIESKSLKLYLNSFNMSKFGADVNECLEICKNIIEKDLEEKLKTKIEANFIENSAERKEIFKKFQNIMNFVDEKTLKVEKFKEAPELLETIETEDEKSYYLKFDSLRSNCRVTHQPDFGDLYLYYKSKKHILEDSLVKYLSSFRSEYHFHEECCEMIFKRLYDLLNNGDKLFVCALYTRRGGIDICPARWSKSHKPDEVLTLGNVNKFARGSIKQ